MTNADKVLRQMTDEGLLKWLDKIGYACMSDDRWRAWLAEDADENKTEEEEGK